jgi:hypothetical protein
MAILPNVSGILALLYTDTMEVRRYPDGATDEDGAISTDLLPDPVSGLEAVPCRMSLGAKDSPRMSDDANPADVQPVLICRPDVPLKSGDFVTVVRQGTVIYSGNIGRPSLYGSSLQVLFRDKEYS